MLVLEGLVGLHRTVQFQLLQHYWWGQRRITVVLNDLLQKRTEITLSFCTLALHFGLFVEYEGYSIFLRNISPIPVYFSLLVPRMSTFTLAIFCLTTSNLPWFMDLTFQVPMQYCSLQHRTLLLSPVTSATGCCFWLHPFILSGVISPLISSSILGTYRLGEFIFQCPIFLLFHVVHGVLKARILKWFAIPFSRGPHSVRSLHHDPSILGSPTWHGLVSLR